MNLRPAFQVLMACALLWPVGAAIGAESAPTAAKTDCDPAVPATWPACTLGDLCLCVGGGGEYRRDKVMLNQFVIYQGGSPMRIQADHAEASALDFDNSTWTLTGAVSVRLSQGGLAAARATGHFIDGRLSSSTGSGAPATSGRLPGAGQTPR